MSEDNKSVDANDPKAKMLAALAKKQKGGNSGKAGGPSSGSKIGAGQTISHPFTVAFQTEKLEIQKGDKILEIGTGCGYQTAVLLEIGAKVYSIERQKELYEKTKVFLPLIGFRGARLVYGDGYKGLPHYAPFDKIIVTAAAPYIPEDLLNQLKIGGILVIPLGDGEEQVMNVIIKKTEREFDKQTFGKFKFVPMLQDKQ